MSNRYTVTFFMPWVVQRFFDVLSDAGVVSANIESGEATFTFLEEDDFDAADTLRDLTDTLAVVFSDPPVFPKPEVERDVA